MEPKRYQECLKKGRNEENELTQKTSSCLRTETNLLILLLRALHGWSQAELASAAGLDLKTVQRYETGESHPSRERLEQLCTAAGLPPPLARQGLLPLLGLCLGVVRKERTPPSDSSYEDAGAIGAEIGERLGALAQTRLLLLLAEAEQAWEEKERRFPPRPEHRLAAREAWSDLQTRTGEERALLLESAEELWTWAMAELLCAESGRLGAESPFEEAEILARLALGVAERVHGDDAWKAHLQGYATAFLANARAARGDLEGADRTLARAWALWNAGLANPSPLQEWRLLEIEAGLRRAQGRFEEALALQERVLRAKEASPEREGFDAGPAPSAEAGPVH